MRKSSLLEMSEQRRAIEKGLFHTQTMFNALAMFLSSSVSRSLFTFFVKTSRNFWGFETNLIERFSVKWHEKCLILLQMMEKFREIVSTLISVIFLLRWERSLCNSSLHNRGRYELVVDFIQHYGQRPLWFDARSFYAMEPQRSQFHEWIEFYHYVDVILWMRWLW